MYRTALRPRLAVHRARARLIAVRRARLAAVPAEGPASAVRRRAVVPPVRVMDRVSCMGVAAHP
ncbi:hypothetical protein ABZZ80_21225, partial [Streptomyces sp. NPDC006356]